MHTRTHTQARKQTVALSLSLGLSFASSGSHTHTHTHRQTLSTHYQISTGEEGRARAQEVHFGDSPLLHFRTTSELAGGRASANTHGHPLTSLCTSIVVVFGGGGGGCWLYWSQLVFLAKTHNQFRSETLAGTTKRSERLTCAQAHEWSLGRRFGRCSLVRRSQQLQPVCVCLLVTQRGQPTSEHTAERDVLRCCCYLLFVALICPFSLCACERARTLVAAALSAM